MPTAWPPKLAAVLTSWPYQLHQTLAWLAGTAPPTCSWPCRPCTKAFLKQKVKTQRDHPGTDSPPVLLHCQHFPTLQGLIISIAGVKTLPEVLQHFELIASHGHQSKKAQREMHQQQK